MKIRYIILRCINGAHRLDVKPFLIDVVLQIISLMLRDQNAEVLASASVQRSDEEKQRDEQELMAVIKKEVEDKQKKMKKHIAAR